MIIKQFVIPMHLYKYNGKNIYFKKCVIVSLIVIKVELQTLYHKRFFELMSLNSILVVLYHSYAMSNPIKFKNLAYPSVYHVSYITCLHLSANFNSTTEEWNKRRSLIFLPTHTITISVVFSPLAYIPVKQSLKRQVKIFVVWPKYLICLSQSFLKEHKPTNWNND